MSREDVKITMMDGSSIWSRSAYSQRGGVAKVTLSPHPQTLPLLKAATARSCQLFLAGFTNLLLGFGAVPLGLMKPRCSSNPTEPVKTDARLGRGCEFCDSGLYIQCVCSRAGTFPEL
eukprot:5424241-Amphidinium_carterae.1